MLVPILVMAAIFLYFFIQAIHVLKWLPGAYRQLKAGDTTCVIPFGPATLWALFSLVMLLSSLDALRDQPCWITCGLDSDVALMIRFIIQYLILNAIPILLIGMAWWKYRINQRVKSTLSANDSEE